MRRYVYGFVHNDHDAEDIVQSVFAKLIRFVERYEWRDVHFEAWLFRVARNTALDHVRASSRLASEPIEQASAPGPAPWELAFDLRIALAHLSPSSADW